MPLPLCFSPFFSFHPSPNAASCLPPFPCLLYRSRFLTPSPLVAPPRSPFPTHFAETCRMKIFLFILKFDKKHPLFPHLLHPVLNQRSKRNENPSRYLLHLLPALPLAEKREPRPAQFTPKVARRWAGCARFLIRPRRFHRANSLPRVVPSALRLLSLSARAVLKSSTFAQHLLPPIQTPPPDEKRKLCQAQLQHNPSAAGERRSRGTFPLQPDEKRKR